MLDPQAVSAHRRRSCRAVGAVRGDPAEACVAGFGLGMERDPDRTMSLGTRSSRSPGQGIVGIGAARRRRSGPTRLRLLARRRQGRSLKAGGTRFRDASALASRRHGQPVSSSSTPSSSQRGTAWRNWLACWRPRAWLRTPRCYAVAATAGSCSPRPRRIGGGLPVPDTYQSVRDDTQAHPGKNGGALRTARAAHPSRYGPELSAPGAHPRRDHRERGGGRVEMP